MRQVPTGFGVGHYFIFLKNKRTKSPDLVLLGANDRYENKNSYKYTACVLHNESCPLRISSTV